MSLEKKCCKATDKILIDTCWLRVFSLVSLGGLYIVEHHDLNDFVGQDSDLLMGDYF